MVQVSVDETTDIDWRYIAWIIIGGMKEDLPGEMFLLTCEVLKRVNITMLFNDSMKLLWPNGVKRKNSLLFVTDVTPYVTKIAKELKTTLPKNCPYGLH